MLIAAAACEDASEPTAPPSSSPTAAASTPARPATPTATSPPTVVATPPATSTPEPTPTATPTATPLPSPTPTPRPTPVPTAAPPRATSTPAQTATPTPQPTSAATPSPTPEPTPTATATLSPTPQPTPTATATPSPTPQPTPTAIATPSPTPHPGVALIEPAPDAFEHHTFETGEDIDWAHGIFVTDPETGLTEGYRVPGADPEHTYYRRPGGWLTSYDLEGSRLLLDRKTGRSWRWPRSYDGIRLLKASEQHLLFEDLDSAWPYYTGRFTVVSREMEEVARFLPRHRGRRSTSTLLTGRPDHRARHESQGVPRSRGVRAPNDAIRGSSRGRRAPAAPPRRPGVGSSPDPPERHPRG